MPEDAPSPEDLIKQASAGFPVNDTPPTPSQRPQIRILPDADDLASMGPTPDENVHIPEEWAEVKAKHPPTEQTIEVPEAASDSNELLTEVLDKRRWRSPLEEAGTQGRKRADNKHAYDIDERIVRAMALVGGTMVEIAHFFGCHEETIRLRYGTMIKEARASRKMRLRQAQYILAVEERNPTMLIWLGKQELGQIDESRLRVGDLSRFSDDELAQLAQGKVPGNLLGPGITEDGKNDK